MAEKKERSPEEIRQQMSELGKRSRGGGRRRIPDDQMTPKQLARRKKYEKYGS
jgi:hypothetical protein